MKLYTDGSTIVKNPSQYGGTYAFILVDDVYEIGRGSGVITPASMGTATVTNNQVELLAVLLGLEWAREAGHKVTKIISDSKVTLGRLFQGWAMNNIPGWLFEKKVRTPLKGVRGEFVKGHNGDTWNEAADQLAEMEAIQYLEKMGFQHLIYAHENPPWKRNKP